MQSHLILDSYLQKTTLAAATLLLVLVGCSENTSEPQIAEPTAETRPSGFELLNPELSTAAKQIALDYAEQIRVDFSQVSIEIEKLQSAIGEFLAQTNIENLDRARQSWLLAHSAYELTTLHRYFAASILDEQNSIALLQLQYQINHWPIVPGYLDYVDGYPDSGIVHDINVSLDSIGLRDQHGAFDISEVTLGFHVLEFLLWGSRDTQSELRSVDDFIEIDALDASQIESGYSLEQLSNNRRRQLLAIIADILLGDFRELGSLWSDQLERAEQSIDRTSQTELITTLADSMSAMLTEELLLRSLYPMLNGDFVESIQSPYSLSTQNAVSSQLSSLESLLLESQSENGTTLDLVFSAISDEFSEFFYQNFDASKSCLVLLYSNTDNDTASTSTEREIGVVECINLLTNMIDNIDRLKLELSY
jgi:putative iron-regulated protein